MDNATHDRYRTDLSYEWNFAHPPSVPQCKVPAVAGEWTFCGQRIESPLGIPAGPLLNGAWCLYYAALGFDVVTYKTVRSGERACYDLPNLLPVDTPQLSGGEVELSTSDSFSGSWAISFGMPSMSPDFWQADIAETRRQLPTNKILVVSVVGTVQPGWSLERLAEDYAHCSRLAVESGADAIEINLSCPNVTSCDGQLYQNPSQARLVTQRCREAIGNTPLIAKIGHDRSSGLLMLVDALAECVDAIATTNCVAATVQCAFAGQPRGIGGKAILDASVRQVERIAERISQQSFDLRVIGVGGIFTADDVRRYLSAGAEHTHLATAVMRDPRVGLQIRRDLGDSQSS